MEGERRCYFCNEPSVELVCESDRCRSYDHELMEYRREEARREWRSAFIPAIRDHCKYDTEWELNILQRWLYTLKVLVCLLFGRWTRGSLGYDTTIHVAEISYTKTYGGWNGEYLHVGRGLFRNWIWEVERDGDSYM